MRHAGAQQSARPADISVVMRRLVAQQAVTVDLDPENGCEVDGIDCRVGWVLGPVATLTPLANVAGEVRDRLTTGAAGYMTFQHGRAMVALRGIALLAGYTSELVEFVVIDGIQVTERRSAARLALITPIRAAPVDTGGNVPTPIVTVTSNLSLGGALLPRRPGLGDGPRWQIELTLPDDPIPIRCDALAARHTPTHVGVSFANMSDADQLRLARTLADHQRRIQPSNSPRPGR